MQPDRISSVVIVGGGTAGWMAAAALAHHLRGTGISITLIESSEIGTVGVGEATIPTIRRFYAQLGMSDAEVLAATGGTGKLGIRFTDWTEAGSSFVHPFGLFGQELRGIGFHHFWLKLRSAGDQSPLQSYSLGASLAEAGRFTTPSARPPSQLSIFDWALHIDASLFAQHLRRFAERSGCARIDAKIGGVILDPANGFIRSVALDDGRQIEGDLFVDCSGFRSLLLGEALGVEFEDWSEWLLCDSAFAVQSEGRDNLPSYTEVTARRAGWQWRIPLRHRIGNGLVFSSRFISDDQAIAELRSNIGEPLLGEPRRLHFRPGRRAQAWKHNCVGLGLAAGFLEPLESTSIALVETGIERLKSLFPDCGFDTVLADEYNAIAAQEMERVRDFLILHYALNRRPEPFWTCCREAALPESLERKMALFRSRGHFAREAWEMFSPASWLAIYAGFGFLPETYDPAVDAFDEDYLCGSLAAMRQSIAATVEDTLTHSEFLALITDSSAAQNVVPTMAKQAAMR
jgi:tryptophan 7-halogenase